MPVGQVVGKQLYGGKLFGGGAAWLMEGSKFRVTGCHGRAVANLHGQPAHGNGGSQRPSKNTTQGPGLNLDVSLLLCVSRVWPGEPSSLSDLHHQHEFSMEDDDSQTAEARLLAESPHTPLEARGCCLRGCDDERGSPGE